MTLYAPVKRQNAQRFRMPYGCGKKRKRENGKAVFAPACWDCGIG